MTARRLALAASLTLVFSACSGDADASPGTTVAAEAPATSTTDAVAPPEATAPTTEPAPDTSPPTLPAEPTTTATSAPPDEDQVKQDVINAAIASWTAFNDLKLDPTNDDKLAALAQTATGTLLDRSIEVIVDYRVNGKRSVVNERAPSYLLVDTETVNVDLGSDLVTLESCRVSSNILVEVGGNADGSDRVLDDSIVTYRESSEFVRIDGRWFEAGGVVLERMEGVEQCPS